jgi:hypothetical protein
MSHTFVMPGLDPGIHQSSKVFSEMMDCRVKPGNDSFREAVHSSLWRHGLLRFARNDVFGCLKIESEAVITRESG